MTTGGKTPEEQKLEDLLNLQAAFRSSGQEVPAKLSMEISSLAGLNPAEQQGSELDRDKQKQRMDLQVAVLVSHGIEREVAMRHAHFTENGFGGYEDIQEYGGMLDNKKYRDFLLSDTPEAKAERAKVEAKTAEYYAEKINNGEMTIEQARQEFTSAPKTKEGHECACEVFEGAREKIRELTSGKSQNHEAKNSEISKMLSPVAGLSSQERVDDLVTKADKVEDAIITSRAITSVEANEVKEDRREAAKEIRQEVYANAEKNGIKTDKQDFKAEQKDAFASLLAGDDSKVAANTLKKTQDSVAKEPTSKPSEVQVVENSKAAEKATTETGIA